MMPQQELRPALMLRQKLRNTRLKQQLMLPSTPPLHLPTASTTI